MQRAEPPRLPPPPGCLVWAAGAPTTALHAQPGPPWKLCSPLLSAGCPHSPWQAQACPCSGAVRLCPGHSILVHWALSPALDVLPPGKKRILQRELLPRKAAPM